MILDTKEHSRLIADAERVCTQAGIQQHFLHETMTVHCGPIEIDWVKHFWAFRKAGVLGLMLKGIEKPDTRCQAIAAALVRNFVDARVIPVNTLIDGYEDTPSPTVLLVPNLYMAVMHKTVPAWRVQKVYDLLLERATRNKPSVVYVEDMKSIGKVFGIPFVDFLTRFVVVED